MTQDASITATKLIVSTVAKWLAIVTWGFALAITSVTLASAGDEHDAQTVQLVAPFTGE